MVNHTEFNISVFENVPGMKKIDISSREEFPEIRVSMKKDQIESLLRFSRLNTSNHFHSITELDDQVETRQTYI